MTVAPSSQYQTFASIEGTTKLSTFVEIKNDMKDPVKLKFFLFQYNEERKQSSKHSITATIEQEKKLIELNTDIDEQAKTFKIITQLIDGPTDGKLEIEHMRLDKYH
jgi:hypothetical protein